MQKEHFYSNGKLLLTGEYVVLDGADALAIPTKFGQSLEVMPKEGSELLWTSLDHDEKQWFQEQFTIEQSGEGNDVLAKLIEILQTAKKFNPDFLDTSHGWELTTKLDFPRNWGLGSSSTLINNIAQWAQIDAFKLLHASFGGSGYDIAAAQHDQPIIYSQKDGIPTITPVQLNWSFTDQLFFVHLNEKQDSKEGIGRYRAASEAKKIDIAKISLLTLEVLEATDLPMFIAIMERHEQLIAEIIQLQPIKERLFPSYKGLIKSLGAWGGDFVLASGGEQEKEYFRSKGYTTLIDFTDMIK